MMRANNSLLHARLNRRSPKTQRSGAAKHLRVRAEEILRALRALKTTAGRHSPRPLLAVIGLAAASLACSVSTGGGQDIPATVNAIGTNVQLTFAAQTGLPPATLPTPLPSLTPISAFTPVPPASASSLPPASPPALATPLIPTPTGELLRPNGVIIHALHLTTAPQIDGDLTEWGTLAYTIDQVVYKPENWTGPADQSATFAMVWDAASLYVAAHVVDDVHVQTQTGEAIFKGDSLEILMDTDLGGDYSSQKLSADDFQLGLTPGDEKISGPDAYLWFPKANAGRPAGVTVAAHPDESGNGYYLEAAIPWSVFGLNPAAGNRFGFALSSSDDDTPDTAEQQSMISTSPVRALANPTTWGTLVLDN
jgi:cellulose/xylan binding protein with CBM9 domain